MINIKIDQTLGSIEEIASYLEVVARDVREGYKEGEGWDSTEEDDPDDVAGDEEKIEE